VAIAARRMRGKAAIKTELSSSTALWSPFSLRLGHKTLRYY